MSGKVFTRSYVPAFERTHNTCVRKPRQPAPFLRRGYYFLYACIARHAPCTFLVRTVCGARVVRRWARLPGDHRAMAGDGVAADVAWLIGLQPTDQRRELPVAYVCPSPTTEA